MRKNSERKSIQQFRSVSLTYNILSFVKNCKLNSSFQFQCSYYCRIKKITLFYYLSIDLGDSYKFEFSVSNLNANVATI